MVGQRSFIWGTGRRKTAVSRVWLTPGTGNILINEEPFEEALPTLTLQGEILEPLQVANLRNKFDVKAVTKGGGVNGQAGAIKLAISRNLRGLFQRINRFLKLSRHLPGLRQQTVVAFVLFNETIGKTLVEDFGRLVAGFRLHQ